MRLHEVTGRIVEELADGYKVFVNKDKGTGMTRSYLLEIEDISYSYTMRIDLYSYDGEIEQLHIGEVVTVKFAVNARKWNDKYYNNVKVYSVQRHED